MATIRKRNNRYQVQVRVRGANTLSRTFSVKADAQRWAKQMDLRAETQGLPEKLKTLDHLTVGELLRRYELEITPTKRGHMRERFAIRALQRHEISKSTLTHITEAKVATYRDARLKTIKPASINRELAIFRHAFETARRLWGIPLSENPFALVKRPKANDARNRRLEVGEWDRLRDACSQSRNPYILPMVEFGLETAMRRGEVLALSWSNISIVKRTLLIPMSKNGYSRTIPLTKRAIQILNELNQPITVLDARVFPTTEEAIKMAWRRVINRCQLPDFRYHDLRHEAITRFFELGLSIPEVSVISGHRDYKMLVRYTHLRAEDLANKLP